MLLFAKVGILEPILFFIQIKLYQKSIVILSAVEMTQSPCDSWNLRRGFVPAVSPSSSSKKAVWLILVIFPWKGWFSQFLVHQIKVTNLRALLRSEVQVRLLHLHTRAGYNHVILPRARPPFLKKYLDIHSSYKPNSISTNFPPCDLSFDHFKNWLLSLNYHILPSARLSKLLPKLLYITLIVFRAVRKGHSDISNVFCLYSGSCSRLLSNFRLREYLSRPQSSVLLPLLWILAHTIPSMPFCHVYLIALDPKVRITSVFREVAEPSLHFHPSNLRKSEGGGGGGGGALRWAYSSIRAARCAARSGPKMYSSISCIVNIFSPSPNAKAFILSSEQKSPILIFKVGSAPWSIMNSILSCIISSGSCKYPSNCCTL